MRIATLLKILIGLIVLVVALSIVAVLVIDPNEYKDEIVAAVEARTGRDFSIESDLSLKLGLTPSIAVRGARLANTEWSSYPEMLRIGEFAAEIALLPLIAGDLQINRLVLRDANIVIETDAGGRSNLDFAETQRKGEPGDGTSALPHVNRVLIENAALTVIDGVQNTTTRLEIERLSAAADNLSQPLAIELAATATLDGQSIEFGAEGEIGAPNRLIGGARPYPVNLQITGFGLTAAVAGEIANPLNAKGLNLSVVVSGPNLQGLTPLVGGAMPPAGPLSLSAELAGDADNATINNIALTLGQTEFTGNASIDTRGKRPRLSGTVTATRIDLRELSPESNDTAAGETPDRASTAAVPQASGKEKLFPSEPLPLDLLNVFDGTLEVQATEMILSAARLSDIKASISLDNGALAVKPLAITISGSPVSGNIGVDTRGGPASISAELHAPSLDLGALLRDFADLDQLRGNGAVDIALRGTGGSVADITASLNGHTRLLMDQGEIKNDFLGNISGLTQTIGEAFGKKEWIVVECMASDFEVKNGIANSRLNAVNTELLLITVEGKVDLGQEKLDLTVAPRPKGIDLSLAVPVHIGGSLASPTFAPDTLATARKVGGIIGAIAFPPAAVLGLGELGSTDHPCLQTTQAGDAPPAQTRESAKPAEAVKDTAKDAIESVGEGVKKLFGQ